MSEDSERGPDNGRTAESGQAPEADHVSDTGQVPAAQEPPAAPKPERRPAGARSSRMRELGVAVIAILLYLLLLDAAVETFLSGSPLRWIVSGVMAGYAALTALLWRRLSWAARAALSLLLFFAVLAATAWLPEGFDRGVVVARQPTAGVLAAAAALAVLAAGVALVRLGFVPAAVKVLIGLVALYASGSFGLAIAWGTPYAQLFHGRAFWERLPFWLQGTFVGALVLVPLAFALQLGDGLARLRSIRTGRWATLLATLGLSLAITLAARVPGIPLAAPSSSGPLATGTPSPASLPAVLQPAAPGAPAPPPTAAPQPATTGAPALVPPVTPDELVRLLKAYQKLPAMADRASFDVSARAVRLGNDLVSAFAFVRDQIANEIYPGVLRGPGSTLSAQAGNDADKALLLGALLQAQQRQVRYARCTLDQAAAHERVRAMFARTSPAPAADLSQPLRAALIREGLSERRAADLVESGTAAYRALDEAVNRTAAADLAVLRDALTRARITPQPSQPALLEEARNHYWVQVQDGTVWRDLDPAFPAAQPGQTFCPAADIATALPAEAYQYVTVRVKNEHSDGNALRTTTVLEQRLPAWTMHGADIIFSNLPLLPDDFQGDISALRRFAPAIVVGESHYAGKEFQTVPGAAGTMGVLGSELSGSDVRPVLVGQWLEFELTAPGRTTVVKRPVVDLVAPKARAAGTADATSDVGLVNALLLEPYVITVSTGRLDLAQVIEAAYSQIDAEAVGRLAAAGTAAAPSEQLLSDFASVQQRVLVAQTFALAHAADRTLGEPWRSAYPHARLFRDQPLIVVGNYGVRRSADGQLLLGGLVLDLRHNVAQAAAEGPEWKDEAFWLNVHHGLVDGALERHLFAHVGLTGGEVASILSTSGIFERARSQGIGAQAAAGQEAVRALQQGFAETGGYRLAREVGGDTAVVFPARPVRVDNEDRLGAWTVDLRSGHTIAVLDTGLRSATERAKLERMLKEVLIPARDWYWRNCVGMRIHQNCAKQFRLLMELHRKWVAAATKEGLAGMRFQPSWSVRLGVPKRPYTGP